ncbi:MAG: Uma2 family endonuclease [Mycobacteriales bacterium]|nr:Uma2 family endonuclease [Mycobacteriales bacterium]
MAVETGVRVHPDVLALVEELGLRHEVIDGALVLDPPPTPRHQRVVMRFLTALTDRAPDGVEVFGGLGFFYDAALPSSYVIPDVSVVRTSDVDDEGTHVPPLLVVEVLSPSTRRRDLAEKRDIYAESGVASYWVVDPRAQTVVVHELVDGHYVETARVEGEQELVVERPLPMRCHIF